MHPPIYDIDQTYEHNLSQGPNYSLPIPKRPPSYIKSHILGKTIASPIGVAAGPLLNSKWISLASKLGYDILTYKTIRSQYTASHPLPNILHVNSHNKQFTKEDVSSIIYTTNDTPNQYETLSITNSFGMPSMSLEYLKDDLPKARKSIRDDQLFIVSIAGTQSSEKKYVDDVVFLANFAKEHGAEAIEVNFSCPNVFENQSALYLDPSAIYTLSKAIISEIAPLPLIIKVGLFPTPEQLENSLIAAAKAGVQAVCGINTISMKVRNKNDTPALSSKRLTSGICGTPIRQLGMEFVHTAFNIIKKKKLNLAIWGVGGVLEAEHFNAYLDLGAKAAFSASGMMWKPLLAQKYHMNQHLRNLTHA
jgi:dihydroorotate dehydrogenase (NAD+) catalytic subunit